MLSAFSYDQIPVLSNLEPGRYRIKIKGDNYSAAEFNRSLSVVFVDKQLEKNEQHTVINCTPKIGSTFNIQKLYGANTLSIGWNNGQDVSSYAQNTHINYAFTTSDLLSSRIVIDKKTVGLQVNSATDNNQSAFVRNVQIGSNVKKIEPFCFSTMPYLTAVHFADGTEPLEIGEYAFANDIGLISHLVLPKRTKVIRKGAFANCHNLKVVTIPDSIVKIERGAFYNCKNLQIIVVQCTRTLDFGKKFIEFINKDGRLFTNRGLDLQNLFRKHALKFEGNSVQDGKWPMTFDDMKKTGIVFEANKIISAKCTGAAMNMRFREYTSKRIQTIFPIFIEG